MTQELKLTKAQLRQLRALAETPKGKSYATQGLVHNARLKTWAALQRLGLVVKDSGDAFGFIGYGDIVAITDAGRAALRANS